ncbi:MFS transporter [Kingella negevensis]|uniref:MFS transporter n=1 Tax=Kingella negevensis TaxID=1522312 RepID=UPI00254A28FE|nr:MFS transporter [Kingella negevensis]MDK4684289.1 MFS transporter [Kingella negevensis]MDK4706939.1 MFS transporter [Kingella negevensis]MDK4710519.1 MFS transporter [Kingella negevensis]
MHHTDENPNQTYFSDNPEFPSKIIVFTLFIGAFFGYLNDTLLNVALTKIMADFHVDKTTVQWLTTGFLLIMGAFTPITANLIQWLETRKMVLITQTIFLVGSLICMFTPNFPVLMFGRVFQAIAAAFFVPILFKRGKAMGVITMMFTAAPAMGPTISGVIIDHLSWRYLFWLTIPFMVLAMLLVSKFLTVNLSDITKPKVDIPSVIASILGFGGLVYASSNFESLPLAVFVAVMIISLMIIAFFVKRQLTLDVPLLNLRVFEFKQFRYAAIILVCGSFLFLGMELLFPMYAQQVLLMTGTTTGLMLMPASIAQAIAAPLFGALLDKKGGRFMLIPATIALLGSLGAMWTFLDLQTNTIVLTILFTAMAVSVSACITGETHGLNALPRELNPHGASTLTTLNPIAGALGAAFFVGMTSIGEKMSQATNPQQDMLNGIHLAMACAFVVAVIAVLSAFQIRTNDWRKH